MLTAHRVGKVRWARTGHPDWTSFNHDLYRGLKGGRGFWVILVDIMEETGIPVLRLADGVRVARRGGAEVWMNFNEAASLLPDGSTIAPVSFQMRG